jgi:hypothetical protein
MHKKIGQYFVEKRILSAEEVEHLARKLIEHNSRVCNRSRQTHRHKQAL